MSRPADAFVNWLARFLQRVFFRRIEVIGLERYPENRPVVVAANHHNGLVDPVLLMANVPGTPRFLAKSTLWKIPVFAQLMNLAGVVPVYRPTDPGVDSSRNVETFARCHELLAEGGTIALFPEGTSHSEPGLQPLKTGAARIVLEAERRFGPLGVRVVPVGLIYDEKERFRSRVLVQLGEPLDPAPELTAFEAAGEDDDEELARQAVHELTDRIDHALAGVTISHGSWEEARVIARAADLYGRPALDVPRRRRLSETLVVRRAFVDAYEVMRERHPEQVAAVRQAVEKYDELLRAFGLRDEQVAVAYAPRPVARFLRRTLPLLLVALPMAVVGTVLNAVPYRLLRLLARRFEDLPDQQATFKIFPGLVLYPLTWAAEAAVAGWLVGEHTTWPAGPVAALTFFTAPLTGWVALRFHETRKRLTTEARGFLVLRTRRHTAEVLRERRLEVYRQIEELAALYFTEESESEEPQG